jgi:hypothetical protein
VAKRSGATWQLRPNWGRSRSPTVKGNQSVPAFSRPKTGQRPSRRNRELYEALIAKSEGAFLAARYARVSGRWSRIIVPSDRDSGVENSTSVDGSPTVRHSLYTIMTVFAIIAPSEFPALSEAILMKFPNDNLTIAPGQWLVAGKGTAKDISDSLGITEGKVSTAIVFTIVGFYGYAAPNIWEWIAAKLNQKDG